LVTTLKDIMEILDGMAPFSLAEEWDNAGLQVGSPSQVVKKILIALDPTLESIRYASDIDAQILLTHHPLIFTPLSLVNSENYPGSIINEALTRKISIISLHTNLDAAKGGINDILANLIGLQGVEVLQKKDVLMNDGAGMGRIGNLSETKHLSEVSETVKEALGASEILIMGAGEMGIRRVAVVGGAGGGMAVLASKSGADLLITGDIRHHEALLADTLGLALIDGGHFQTEKAALNIFADNFRDRLDKDRLKVVIEKYKDERKPMKIG
jgi:dinuclear metal center YbgI/SA1388 family protein